MLYGDLFSNFNAQYRNIFEPYTKFNSLAAKNFSALTTLQLESAQSYASIVLPQVYANSEIKDVQSLMSSATLQMDAMNKLSQQMIDDGKKLAALANDFKAELDKIVADAVPKSNK